MKRFYPVLFSLLCLLALFATSCAHREGRIDGQPGSAKGGATEHQHNRY